MKPSLWGVSSLFTNNLDSNQLTPYLSNIKEQARDQIFCHFRAPTIATINYFYQEKELQLTIHLSTFHGCYLQKKASRMLSDVTSPAG